MRAKKKLTKEQEDKVRKNFLTTRVNKEEFAAFKLKCKDGSAFLRDAVNHYDEVSSFLNTLKK